MCKSLSIGALILLSWVMVATAAPNHAYVLDDATGIRMEVPPELVTGPREGRFGSSWSSADGGISVDTLRFTDRTLDDLASSLRKVAGRKIITDAISGDDLELAGSDADGSQFVIKLQVKGGEIRGISVVYRPRYSLLAQAVIRTGELFPSEAAPPKKSGSKSSIEIVPPTQHTDDVEAMVFSSDENDSFMASTGRDAIIKLWSTATGRFIRNIERVDPNVKFWTLYSLSSSGTRLLGAVGGETVLWNTETGSRVLTISDATADPAMNADGSRLGVVVDNQIGRIFDGNDGHVLFSVNSVNSLALSQDGKYVAVAGSDRSIRLLNATSGQPVTSIQVPEAIRAIQFSPTGRIIAVTGTSGTIHLFDVAKGVEIREFKGNDYSQFAFSWDGKLAVFEDGDGLFTVASAETGAISRTFSPPAKPIAFMPSADDRTIILASSEEEGVQHDDVNNVVGQFFTVDIETGLTKKVGAKFNGTPTFGHRHYVYQNAGKLHVGELDSLHEQAPLVGQTSTIGSVLSQTGSLAAISQEGTVYVIDTSTGKRTAQCALSRKDLTPYSFSADETQLLLAGADGAIVLCDLRKQTERPFDVHEAGIKSLALSSDNSMFMSGNEDGDVKIWNASTGALLHNFKGDGRAADIVAFTPDGRRALAGTDDNKIHVWQLPSGTEIKTFRMLLGPVTAMAISRDGRRVAGGPYSQLVVKQWDLGSGRELRRLKTDYGGRFVSVTSVAYSRSGDHLLAATANNYAVVWDATSGLKKAQYDSHDQSFTAIAFPEDGRRVVTLDEAGVVRHWDENTGALLLTVIPLAGGEWVAITPEGFFDSSGKGAKYLTVVDGLRTFSIDQFYDQLHRPDLVSAKLAGDPEGKVREAAARLDLSKAVATGNAPKVSILSPDFGTIVTASDQVVEASITDQGGGIGQVEWRMNGQLVGFKSAADLGLGSNGIQTGTQRAEPSGPLTVRLPVTLSPGRNRIEVVAYNAQKVIASEPAPVVITLQGPQPDVPPRLYVLAVGVNDYWDSRLRLSDAVADAQSIADGLRKAGKDLYQRIETKTVLDAQATVAGIDQAFTDLGREIRPQDVFVFFMAGHGITIDGRFYFIPQDFHYEGQESIVTKAIGQDQLMRWITRIRASKDLLLFDACDSGSLAQDQIAQRGMEELTAADRLNHAIGRITITATTDDGVANEGIEGHGVFTYALLAGIGRAVPDTQGLIDVYELASYIQQQVPALSYDAFKYRQVPQVRLTTNNNFPLVHQLMLLTPSPNSLPLAIPLAPTHVVITPVTVRQEASETAPAVEGLAAGTQVRLVQTSQGWALIARQGKQLGYVEVGALAALQ